MRWRVQRSDHNGKWSIAKKPGREGPNHPWCRKRYEGPPVRQHRYYSLGTTDIEEATRRLAKWLESNDRPQNARADQVLIDQVLLFYYEDYAKNLPSEVSVRRELALWQEWWAGRSVAEITSEEQKKFRLWLGEGRLTASTIDKYLSAGRAALEYGVKHGMLASSPHIFSIETQGQKEARPPMGRPLLPEEMARFFDAITQEHVMVFTVILANTLARSGAILDLARSQYDGLTNRVALNPDGRPQTKKRRPSLPVTPTLQPWLDQPMRPEQHYVTYEGEPVHNMKTAWRNTVVASGLEGKVTTYSFRHGMARLMRQRRIPLDEIGTFMGHRHRGSNATTAIYVPDDPDYLKAAAQAIEEIMGEVKTHIKKVSLDDPKICSAAIRSLQPKGNGQLPKEAYRKMLSLIKAGRPSLEIARKIGVSTTAVYKAKRKHGVK